MTSKLPSGTFTSPSLLATPKTFLQCLDDDEACVVGLAAYDLFSGSSAEVKHGHVRVLNSDSIAAEVALEALSRGGSPLRLLRASPESSPLKTPRTGTSYSPSFPLHAPATPRKTPKPSRASGSPSSSSTPRTPLPPARVITIIDTAPVAKTRCFSFSWLFSCTNSRASVAPLPLAYKLTDSKHDETDLRALINANDNFSAYRGIDTANLYKLFIDQKRWAGNPGNPDPIYKTRMTFDVREPGYLIAMKKAFSYIMQFPKGYFLNRENLNENFVEELHSFCINGVKDSKTHKYLRTGYRDDKAREVEAFGLKSIEEVQEGVTSGITITQEGVFELCARFKAPEYRYKLAGQDESEFHAIADALTPECSRSFRNYKTYIEQVHYAESRLEDTSKIEVVPIPKKMTLQFVRPRASLKPLINQILFVFSELPKETEQQKLEACARVIQDLDQIHPFYDGNIRLFAILLLNRLLFDLDLSPTCLEDPNCFDGLSQAQLVSEIRKGQIHFASLKTR